MGFLSRFEGKMEDTVEGAANSLTRSPISPVQIAKRCEKQMTRSKMVGAGKQYAPTLYTVLVNPDDDGRLFSFYPTLAGETETYLAAKAGEHGLYMDGQPLVRFIVDDGLRHGKFDVIAEVVASSIVKQLRQEEMERYGLAPQPQRGYAAAGGRGQRGQQAPAGYGADARALDRSAAPADPYAPRDGFVAYEEEGLSADDAYDEPYPDDPYDPQAYDGYDEEGYGDPYDDPLSDPYAPAAPVPGQAAAGAAAGKPATQALPQREARPQSSARLVDITNNRTYALRGGRLVAGRASNCDIVIPDINASRNHAEFACQSHGVWTVRDLGSKNGTIVNGRVIGEATTLFEGDRLTMGLTDYMFSMA